MQEESPLPQQEIQIDEEWITHSIDEHAVDPNLLMCMVCYGIPLGEFAECSHCGRIFCYRDFNEISTKHDTCPNCKASPFVKRPKPHILYTSLFERIRFHCQICKEGKVKSPSENKAELMEEEKVEKKFVQNEKMGQEVKKKMENLSIQEKSEKKCLKKFSKQQLFDHINNVHKAQIMDLKQLYEFQIVFDKDSQNIVFDLYQNLELNQRIYDYQNKKAGYKQQVPYHLDSGDYLVIDLKKETAKSTKVKTEGKLLKRLSKTLKKDTEYHVWEIQLDHGFKNYTKKYQDLINEQYDLFLKNKKLNEFIMDIENQRYRISFSKMRQINTYSNFERIIRKTTIKFS